MAKFKKGKSGNLEGRPKGSTNRDKELRQAEAEAMELAANVCDVIKKMATEALGPDGYEKVIPLIEAIIDTATPSRSVRCQFRCQLFKKKPRRSMGPSFAPLNVCFRG